MSKYELVKKLMRLTKSLINKSKFENKTYKDKKNKGLGA